MQKPLSLGLIGVGGFGEYHLAALDILANEGQCRLVAVADPALGAPSQLRSRFESSGIRWHLDYQELLDEEIDALTIVTPIHHHYEMARACIERGIFVMLEKPPVPLIHQLEELIRLDRHGRVAVGFQWIGAECIKRLKRSIVDGQLGAIRDIRVCGCWPRGQAYYDRADWAGELVANGKAVFDGPATNAFAHQVHNLMFLAAEEEEAFEIPTKIEGELYRARPIKSYDLACLRGRFASGAKFAAAFSHVGTDHIPIQIDIQGERGRARISNDGTRLEMPEGIYDCAEDQIKLLVKSYREYLDFINGRIPRVRTRLCDARPYVLSSNAMLLSSGGIHDIPSDYVETCDRGGDTWIKMNTLRGLLRGVLAHGRSFSDLGASWAIKSRSVPLDDLRHVDLGEYLPAEVSEIAH